MPTRLEIEARLPEIQRLTQEFGVFLSPTTSFADITKLVDVDDVILSGLIVTVNKVFGLDNDLALVVLGMWLVYRAVPVV